MIMEHHQGLLHKLTIDGNFAMNSNYYGNLDFDWLFSPVTMVVAIDSKFSINGKFNATGALMRARRALPFLC